MIKLLWNTHNQEKTNSSNEKVKKIEINNYNWGIYHKVNSNIWIYDILKNINYTTIDNENKLEDGDVLIVIDSNPEKKIKLYEKFKLICSKVYLFHLGDETGASNLSQVYDKCNYVLRTFCSNKYFKNEKVKCIPLGYKSGIVNKSYVNRKYKWAFTGTPHKSSRHDLLFQLSDIKPFFCHKTEKFNKQIISVEKMSEVLSSTIFIPCPNGFYHPETYRLYEALECGCIPIVEETYKYFDRLFPNNPFLKINKWIDAKKILQSWESEKIKKKQKECIVWWDNYKVDLQEMVKNKIIQ